MTKGLIVSLYILANFFQTFAQTDSSSSASPRWFLSVHSGALLGKGGHGTSATASLIQGIRYNKLSLGAGVGYDAYRDWRTVPVFASVSYDFSSNRLSTLFVQLNTGYSSARSTAGEESQFDYNSEGGFFYHPQIGYRIHEGRLTVQLSAGYKFQRLSYGQTPRGWIWGYPSGSLSVVRDIERLSIQMGIGIR